MYSVLKLSLFTSYLHLRYFYGLTFGGNISKYAAAISKNEFKATLCRNLETEDFILNVLRLLCWIFNFTVCQMFSLCERLH